MVQCRCGNRDGKYILPTIRVESTNGVSVWVGVNPRLLDPKSDDDSIREFMMYLDANGVVELIRDLRAGLMRATEAQ